MSNSFITYPKFSCALGAQQTVVAIPRAVPILHSGPGCGTKITSMLGQGQGYAGGCTIPCTNADGNDVIFGGTKKLDILIHNTFKIVDADLFVVMTGCTSDIIGDDIQSVVKPYQALNKPIVYVETGGFKSNNYESHSVVVNAIIDQYVDKYKESVQVEPGLVNVFASIPDQDPYFEGNLEELKRVLTGIGLNVNILFGATSEGVEEWKKIPNAQFNVVVGNWVNLPIVHHLQERYGTPYVQYPHFPVGAQQTTEFLYKVAEFGNLNKEKVKSYIEKEEKRFYAYLERMADFVLEFKYSMPQRFYSTIDTDYTIGISKFLVNELGILPGQVYITDETPENYQESIREELQHVSDYRSIDPVFSIDGEWILDEIINAPKKGDYIVFGSAWEAPIAKRNGAGFLEISVPIQYRMNLNATLVGYNGGLRLTEEIYSEALRIYE